MSRRAAHRLIILHHKQNIESELKWQTCSGTMARKFSCSSGKGLMLSNDADYLQMMLRTSVKKNVYDG